MSKIPSRQTTNISNRIADIVDTIDEEEFGDWYRERQYAENIREGKSYFNQAGYVAPEEKHNPSKLLQCHRKVFYKNQNTPVEDDSPHGIFWIGRKFEDEIALPFLEETARDIHSDNYVTQDMYIDYDIEVEGVDLRIRGETDPVITDDQGAPLVVTEIKTTGYIDNKRGPNASPDERHKAQLHAYMAGLSRKYDSDIHKGLIIYGERDSFEMAVFEIDFDEDFWEDRCLEWAQTQTEFRLNDKLPPAEPEQPSWECKYCDFRQRCGQNDEYDWEDTGIEGFVPLTMYPIDEVREYLDAEANRGANLTPTLANQHPGLVGDYDVFDWICSDCGDTFDWDAFDWDVTADDALLNPPSCPGCAEDYGDLPLRGPLPETQLTN